MPVSFHSRKTSPALASRAGSCEVRFRARRRQPQARHWVYLACLSTAAFALLLLALGVTYWHQDAPGSEATCAICHVAHLTPVPGSVVAAVSVPLLIARYELAETQPEQPSPPPTNAPARAPPAVKKSHSAGWVRLSWRFSSPIRSPLPECDAESRHFAPAIASRRLHVFQAG